MTFYYVDNAGDIVVEGAGEGTFDRIFASASYVLGMGVYIEALTTTNAASTSPINLTGNELDNFIGGNNGANVLTGGGGADTMVGLVGDDWYYVDSADDRVLEGRAEGAYDRIFTSASYTMEAGVWVEALTTTDATSGAAINLTGNEIANFIGGNTGANLLDGRGGADTLVGLGGDDWYYVDHVNDILVEKADEGTFDRIFTTVTYTLAPGVHVEALTIADPAGTTAINLTGNEIDNFIGGNAGANVLDGKAGADTMVGLGGNDRYLVDNAGDLVIEGAGEGALDEIVTTVSYKLAAGSQVEVLRTTINNGPLNLTGNEFANRITGSFAANVLDGGGGADTLVGLRGDDWYYVDDANDIVVEAFGSVEGAFDRVFASASYALASDVYVEALTIANAAGTESIDLTGNEFHNFTGGNEGSNVLIGGAGDDTLVGLGGNDSILGGEGGDTLFGGLGNDTLTGGTGVDRFAFNTAFGVGNIDTITDFVFADDTILLDDAVFTGLALGDLPAGAFAIGSTATEADDRIIYNSATGALLFDADGLGGVAAVQFASLGTGLALTASDFLII
ncbi:MAG: calcium-binding protein [Sphingosinicella sp.]|nr:calcium-binding protein [Sphingosinicella sp.]